MKRLQALSWWILAICALLLVGSILVFHPHYGLMDDLALLGQAAISKQIGYFHSLVDFLQGDYRWGMFRLWYMMSVPLLYGIGGLNPSVLFLLNGAWVWAILACLSVVLARWIRGRESMVLAPWILLGALAFPWTHDLFIHPSLQEKWVHLFTAAALFWMGSRPAITLPPVPFAFATALVLAAGFLSKGQFLAVTPALAFVIWLRSPNRREGAWRAGTVLGLSLLAAFILSRIAAQGVYTSGYSPWKAIAHLGNPYLWMLLAVAAGAAISARLDRAPGRLVPEMILVASGFLLLPWRLGGYLLSFMGPFVGASLVAILLGFRGRTRTAGFMGLAVISLLVCGYREITYFSRLGDLGAILSSPELKALDRPGLRLRLPCVEGGYTFGNFLKARGFVNLAAEPDISASTPLQGYWVLDGKLCRSERAFGSPRVLLPSRLPGGFQLIEVE